MTRKLRRQATVLGVSWAVLVAAYVASAQTDPEPASAQTGAQQRGASMPKGVEAISVPSGVIEPGAVDALRRMSAYLITLQTAEINSRGSLDVVTEEGQRVQLDGVTNYKVRKPGFVIDYSSDLKKRRFYYDGKNFTVYAPQTGFYATVPAPPTNKAVLDQIYERYGIALPLEDLFRWNEPDGVRAQALKSAYHAGTATLDGVATDHYALREEEVDWEVWIQKGNQPLPRKLVIVDRTDPAHPTFIARLDWKVNPAFSDSDFAFVPDADDKKIQLATYQGPGE